MNTDAITQAIRAGQLTHTQGIAVYSALFGARADAPALMLPCETCGAAVALADAISYKVWSPMPGRNVAGYDEHDQHFCCSHACAEKAAHQCLAQHIRPEAERRAAQAAQAAQPEPQG